MSKYCPSNLARDILLPYFMALLISFYDNALIYYPNIFFVALFFISILGIILVSIGIIVLGKKIRRVIEEIKRNLSETSISKESNIKQRKRKEEKKISFVSIIRFSTISLAYMIKVIFFKINTALGYIELQTERIVKKIGKEILIEE